MSFILDHIKQDCISKNVPIISDNTVAFLQDFLRKHPAKNYAELWTAQGFSTIIAAEILKSHHASLWTRELSYPQYKAAISNFSLYWYHWITAYYADVLNCDREKFISDKLDIVFIDAQKSHYHLMIESIRAHVVDDWFIILDDVIKFKSKTAKLYHWLDENNIRYTVHQLDDDDGIIVIQK